MLNLFAESMSHQTPPFHIQPNTNHTVASPKDPMDILEQFIGSQLCKQTQISTQPQQMQQQIRNQSTMYIPDMLPLGCYADLYFNNGSHMETAACSLSSQWNQTPVQRRAPNSDLPVYPTKEPQHHPVNYLTNSLSLPGETSKSNLGYNSRLYIKSVRYRRKSWQLSRRFKCPHRNCRHRYEARRSLIQHIKTKHNGVGLHWAPVILDDDDVQAQECRNDRRNSSTSMQTPPNMDGNYVWENHSINDFRSMYGSLPNSSIPSIASELNRVSSFVPLTASNNQKLVKDTDALYSNCEEVIHPQ